MSSTPNEKILEPILKHAKDHQYAIRLCSLTPERTSIQYETEIRAEMTEINPIGLVVYSQHSKDYEMNLDDYMKMKVNRLYENANFTQLMGDHPNLASSRYEDENANIEDVNGFEGHETNRMEDRSTTLDSNC